MGTNNIIGLNMPGFKGMIVKEMTEIMIDDLKIVIVKIGTENVTFIFLIQKALKKTWPSYAGNRKTHSLQNNLVMFF